MLAAKQKQVYSSVRVSTLHVNNEDGVPNLSVSRYSPTNEVKWPIFLGLSIVFVA